MVAATIRHTGPWFGDRTFTSRCSLAHQNQHQEDRGQERGRPIEDDCDLVVFQHLKSRDGSYVERNHLCRNVLLEQI